MNKQSEKAALVYDKCTQVPAEMQIQILQHEVTRIDLAIEKTRLWISTFPKNKFNPSYIQRIGRLVDIRSEMEVCIDLIQSVYLKRKEAAA